LELGKVILLAVACGLLVTAHLALCWSFVWSQRRTRALLALVLPPLAPYYGFRSGRRVWSSIWLLSLLTYVACLLLAIR